MPRQPRQPKSEHVDSVTVNPALPCAYECSRSARFAVVKPVEKTVGGRLLRLWELFPICDLHLKLTIREIEVRERFKHIAQEEAGEGHEL